MVGIVRVVKRSMDKYTELAVLSYPSSIAAVPSGGGIGVGNGVRRRSEGKQHGCGNEGLHRGNSLLSGGV